MGIKKQLVYSSTSGQIWFFTGNLGPRSSLQRKNIRIELVAEILGVDQKMVLVEYGPNDQPRFSVRGQDNNLEVSTSHSDSGMAIATSEFRKIGIDVFALTPVIQDWSTLADQFTEQERKMVFSLAQDLWAWEFARLWSRKEATLKALGFGLQIPPEKIDVSQNLVQIHSLPRLHGRPREVQIIDLPSVQACHLSFAYCL